MKVYLAYVDDQPNNLWEVTEELVGVFSDKQKARNAVAKILRRARKADECLVFRSIEVKELDSFDPLRFVARCDWTEEERLQNPRQADDE